MVSIIEALILSIVQGISEWFPISSSGHLALFQQWFGFQNLPFDVFLHFASVLAVVFVFRKDIAKLFKERNWKYIGLLGIALVPAVVAGLLFKEQISGFFSSRVYLGVFFLLSGAIIYSTKFVDPKKIKIGTGDSIFIGLMQALAILPGISRSGATISGGLFKGLKKEQAVRFSFLLAIPVILGASVFESGNIVLQDYRILLLSFIITFLVSIFTIRVLLKIVKSDKFYLFGIYNAILGLVVLVW